MKKAKPRLRRKRRDLLIINPNPDIQKLIRAALDEEVKGFFELGITKELYTKWPILAHGLALNDYNEFLADLTKILTANGKTLTIGRWSERNYGNWLKYNHLPDLLAYRLEYFFHCPRKTHSPHAANKRSPRRDILQDHMFNRAIPAEKLGYRLGHFTTDELEAIWQRLEEAHQFYLDDEDTRPGANFCKIYNCAGRLSFQVTILPSERTALFFSLEELEAELKQEIKRRAKAGFLFYANDHLISAHKHGEEADLKLTVTANTIFTQND